MLKSVSQNIWNFLDKPRIGVTFERKFRSVASSQGFDYILQEDEFDPDDDIQKKQYQEDSAFIYDAFQILGLTLWIFI